MNSIDEKIAEAEKKLKALKIEKEQEKVLEEFREKGYVAGTVIIPCGFMENRYELGNIITPQFNERGDLIVSGKIIYSAINNTWARIITDPRNVKVGTYSVTVVEGKVFINGKYYTLEELTTLSDLMTSHSDQIKFLMCGCEGEIKVSVEKINAIIQLIKSN